VAERLAGEIISLPMYPGLDAGAIQRVAGTLVHLTCGVTKR
jgi:dTDP-4-amino-4,6-dideoxygalactose transaminase